MQSDTKAVLAPAWQVSQYRQMKRLLCMVPLLLLLGSGSAAAERGQAGAYRLVGEQDVASGLQLGRDGRFQYFLSAGSLDEQARGRWRSDGDVLALSTEPKPVPPLFQPAPSARTASAKLAVKVSSPGGAGIAGVDLRIGFDEGAPVEDYTQEDGWVLHADEERTPRWIELAVPMHGIASPRFPIDLATGNGLTFTLVPNDLGVVDFTGVKVEVDGKALIVHRGSARLRYERVRK
jgi:hypothetical protein